MAELLKHPETIRRLKAFQAEPAHALLLTGPEGSGKYSLAREVAESVLGLEPGSFETDAYGLVIQPEAEKAIGIDAVRQLEHFLSLKVPGREGYNRAVIIEAGHQLSLEAQNALLKTLEEPVAGTLIILTAAQPQALLPTVRSRLQTIAVHRPEVNETEQFFIAQGYDGAAVHRAVAMSGGLPGLTHALLSEPEHPLSQAAETARELLSKPVFERLVMVDSLSKSRSQARAVVFMLQQMAQYGLLSPQARAAKRWQAVQQASYIASEALANNAQPKLVLMNLALQI